MSDYTITHRKESVSIDIPIAGRTIGVDMLPNRIAEAKEPCIAALAAAARHPKEVARVERVARRAFEALLNG